MTKITDLNDSTTSNEEDEETRVKKFAKHMLKSSLFIGTFLEKRYVEPLRSYRDVIKISDEEKEFITNLVAVKKRCLNYFTRSVWIGITEPTTIGAPVGYNLWVVLNEEVFGSYWYKIKNVDFVNNEIRLKLEIVRPVREKTPTLSASAQEIFEDISQHGFANKMQRVFNEMLMQSSHIFTGANIKNTAIFLFFLISTLITFIIQGVQYLMEYMLKLIHELSGLIKVCTPIIISFMRLIMNTINGFYTLIAVMWRDRSATPKVNQNIYQISPYEAAHYSGMKALPYQYDYDQNRIRYPRSSVKITPLD